ncbi:hypothetical protein DOTSEDRAFT_54768, partial [Dothistroma septosporum NZE10]
MGQTSSQVVAPTQASHAAPPPAIAEKNARKWRHERSRMDSNNVAPKRPSKKRRKSPEQPQKELQDVAVQGKHLDRQDDSIAGGEQESTPRMKEKRNTVPDAPGDRAHMAARAKEEKRRKRRAKTAARKAKEATDAHYAHSRAETPADEAADVDTAGMEDMGVTELPTEAIPAKHEPSKSPTGVEWGRQEIRRMLKRKQMEELVLSGQARWHRLANDKWSIRYYQPGAAPAPTELSSEQRRRHDILKQELATYEHTLRTSEETERRRRREAGKENTASVEQDPVAGATNEASEAHDGMDVSSVGKLGPTPKKRRQSETNETAITETVILQPEQNPVKLASRKRTSEAKHEVDATEIKSKKRKIRRSGLSEKEEGEETDSERQKRSARAAPPANVTENEKRPRKKSKRAESTRSASVEEQDDEYNLHVRSADGTVDNASPKQSQELTEAPATLTPPADNETWLDGHDVSGQSSAEVSGLLVEGEQEDLVEVVKPRRKRKKTSDAVDDEAEYAPQPDMKSRSDDEDVEGDSNEPKSRKPARTKTTRVSTEKHRPLAESLQLAVPETTTGTFTVQEQETSDRIFDEVLKRHNYSEAELKAMIKYWRAAGPFKMEMEAALPNRKTDQIRKFCQRRYHAHERGPWTAEQDQALLDAHTRWPGKWSQIADLVDRFAQDCKDRWTKHLQSGGIREVGPWNQAEEDALVNAAEECIAKVEKSHRKDKTLSKKCEYLEALVDWKTVADMLGGKREGKRCREKYHKLMARLTKTGSLSQELPASQLQHELDETVPKKSKHRDVSARRALENFEIGDYYDAFVEVHTAVKDHSAQYRDEQMLLWSIVAQQHPASRFNVSYFGAALRRKAIEKALDEWKIDSRKTRRKLDEAPSIPAKALLLAKWVEKRSGDKLDKLPRKYMPQLIGVSKGDIQQFKKQQQEQRRAKKPKPEMQKSKEYVAESSEAEGAAPSIKAAEEQNEALDDDDGSDTAVHDSEVRDRSGSAKDPGGPSKQDTRSPSNDDEDDDDEGLGSDLKIAKSNQDEAPAAEAAHEVSDTEIDSTHEKVFATSQAARATQETQEVRETQLESSRASGDEASKGLTARAIRSSDHDIV